MKNIFKHFLLCFLFLTAIPYPGKIDSEKEDFSKILPCFVPVGLVIGLILFLFSKLFFVLGISPLLHSALLLVLWALVTGALHLDGVIDTFDGIGCQDNDRKLDAMKDSRVGAIGVIGGVFLILLKFAALETIVENELTASLLLIIPFSRLISVYAIVFLKRNEVNSKSTNLICENASKKDFYINLVIFIIFYIFLCICTKVYVYQLLICVLISFLFAEYLNKKFSGFTGDMYGALIEFSEVVFLLSIAI